MRNTASAPHVDLRAITSALRADLAALGIYIDCVLLAPTALAAMKLANNEWSGATCAKQLRQEAAARQRVDDEGTRAECTNNEGTRAEHANDEQGRAECELALACLRYKQEWPSLTKAKER